MVDPVDQYVDFFKTGSIWSIVLFHDGKILIGRVFGKKKLEKNLGKKIFFLSNFFSQIFFSLFLDFIKKIFFQSNEMNVS